MRVVVSLAAALTGCHAATDPAAEPDPAGCLEVGELSPFVANVELDGAHVQQLELRNRCDGESTVTSLGIDQTTGAFSVGAPEFPSIAAFDTTTVPVTFRPPRRGQFAAFLEVTANGTLHRELELRAAGIGPNLDIAPVRLELGDVPIGCPTSSAVELHNSGESQLDVIEVRIEGDAAWTATPAGSLPHTVLDDGHFTLTVEAAPRSGGRTAATMTVVTAQRSIPDVTVPLGATAVAIETVSEVWDLGERRRKDVVIALDRSNPDDGQVAGVVDAIPDLVEAAVESGIDLQLAIVVSDDGCIVGADPRIDESFSASDAARVARIMADLDFSLSPYGSNIERPLMLVEAATSAKNLGVGGCNVGLVRGGAELHLVSVTDAEGVSTGSWTYYLDLFRALKDHRDELFVHHAIAGPPDHSCSDATAAPALAALSTATGGTFRSYCDRAHHNLGAIAADVFALRAPDGRIQLRLRRDPIPETLKVLVDEQPETRWSWDPGERAVRFDGDATPGPNAIVEIEYVPVPTCE